MKTPSLVLSRYRPKFTDPRVLSRTTAVLEWCKPLLLQKKPKTISSTELTKVFGNQKGQFAAYLRANLLVQSDDYKPGQYSYSYSLKRDGYTKLSNAVGLVLKDDAEVACELYGGIASGEVHPDYSEPTKGARRYHPVQNLPKKLRTEVFKGWFDYDIQAAAPTLVYQLACRIHKHLDPSGTKEPFPSIKKLTVDRTGVRKHLAGLTGLDAKTVKGILISLFFGGNLVPTSKRAIFRLLNEDYEVIRVLKGDPFIRAFCREIKVMWQIVLDNDNAKKGKASLIHGMPLVKKPSTKGKHRMGIYLELERKVMDVIESELQGQGIKPFLIHDGFMTNVQINKSRLEHQIEQRTGFLIQLAEAKVGLQDEDLKDGLNELIEFTETEGLIGV